MSDTTTNGLLKLTDDILFEHIIDRYVSLESNNSKLKQDLGIHDPNTQSINISFSPKDIKLVKKKRRGKNNANIIKEDESSCEIDNMRNSMSFDFSIQQSISGLKSDNNSSSTTGFVVWSTLLYFVDWLLYDTNQISTLFCNGGNASIIGLDEKESTVHITIPGILNQNERIGIIELGSGIAGILPIVLGNFVSSYIATDQKAILNTLKNNITENISQINRKECQSKSLDMLDSNSDVENIDNNSNEMKQTSNRRYKTRKIKEKVSIEVTSLDWEKFQIFNSTSKKDTLLPASASKYPELFQLVEDSTAVYIVAIDVIYNDYLIDPLLQTLSQIFQLCKLKNIKAYCLMGIQLRAQDVVSDFLEKAITEYTMQAYYLDDESMRQSRFSFYLLSQQ